VGKGSGKFIFVNMYEDQDLKLEELKNNLQKKRGRED